MVLIFLPHCEHPAYKTEGWLKWWQQLFAMRNKKRPHLKEHDENIPRKELSDEEHKS